MQGRVKFVGLFLLLIPQFKCNIKMCGKQYLQVWRATDEDKTNGRSALDRFPLIDGHNDLAWVLAIHKQNQLQNYDFTKNVTNDESLPCPQCSHTDLAKLKQGKVGAQFWAAYVPCTLQYKDVVAYTLEQVDVLRRFFEKYSKHLMFTKTSKGILKAFKEKKIGSLIGVEGGHSIGNRLSILRIYYLLGVRYMTLAHACNTPWIDASPVDTNTTVGLTDFGKKVIWEMNRLGMMVDLSHISYIAMKAALETTKAPVIFSHSSAHAVYQHHRNVRDDVLELVKQNGGVVMVNFYPKFIGPANASIQTAANHINHIAKVCGVDCVGIGGDYSGVQVMPEGLENVSKYPDLFDFLKEHYPELWTISNLEKLAGRNLVRVFKKVEKVSQYLRAMQPIEDWIPQEELRAASNEVMAACTTEIRNGTFNY